MDLKYSWPFIKGLFSDFVFSLFLSEVIVQISMLELFQGVFKNPPKQYTVHYVTEDSKPLIHLNTLYYPLFMQTLLLQELNIFIVLYSISFSTHLLRYTYLICIISWCI